MRVLIVKTSSMGDVLHTLPALTDAAQAIPGIRFEWVVEEGFAQIPHGIKRRTGDPVAIRRWRKAQFSAPIKAERQTFREAVQAVKYDAIIDAQGLVKSAALVTRPAHGVKHGMDWQSAREPLASLFYNRRHHIAKQQHAVERTRELFAKSLGYAKPQTRGDYAIARHFLQHEASAAAPIWCFCTPPPATISTGRKPTGRSFSICWPTAASTLSCRGAPRTKRRGRSGWRKAGCMSKCCRA